MDPAERDPLSQEVADAVALDDDARLRDARLEVDPLAHADGKRLVDSVADEHALPVSAAIVADRRGEGLPVCD